METDQPIAALYAAGDPDATAALAEKYGRLFARIAEGILADPRDAEECVNDALLTVWERWETDRPQNLLAYACTVVRTTALDRLDYNRAKKRDGGELLPLDEYAELLPDEAVLPDADGRELGRAIDAFLRSQKPQRADIFVRRYVFCDTIPALAKRYRCTQAKIRNLLARMRAQLRDYLKKEGYEIDE